MFYTPFKWMDAVVESLDTRMTYDGSGWIPFGLIMKDTGEYLRVGHQQEDVTVIQKYLESLDAIDFSHPSCYRAYSLIKQDIEDLTNTVYNDMEKLFSFKDVLVCRAIDMMNQRAQLTAQ